MRDSEDSKFAREQLIAGKIVKRRNQLAASQITRGAEDYHDARITRPPHSGLRRNRHCRCVEHFQLPRNHANVTPSSCWLWVPRVRRTSGAWLRAFLRKFIFLTLPETDK